MKKITLLIVLSFSTLVFSQKSRSTKIGKTTLEELKMESYSKDTTAKAVVLFDHANVYIDEDKDFDFRTDYYQRIKFFDKSHFGKATVNINLYKEERVIKIKAVTYNLVFGKMEKTILKKNQIFDKKPHKDWKVVSFTLPNLKEGCVIEFQYSVISPYPNIDDWYFQQDIPVVQSIHNSLILGNWKYRTRIIGYRKFDREEMDIKKGCVYIPYLGKGNCLDLHYEMKDIPAFQEEDYMTAKKNFMSRLVFDLESFTNTKGVVKKYSTTWDKADKTLKSWYLDNQTEKTQFFKNKIPTDIQEITDELARAKAAYYFIQDRMSWNGNNRRKKIRVKKSFEEKSGSVDVINLILLNTLKALNINANVVMSSTRGNGYLTKLYPITDGFNYVTIKANINNKDYFLDASDKFLTFGQLPLKCLNGDGRVLDFEKGSYWQKMVSTEKANRNVKVSLSFDEDLNLNGKLSKVYKGYFASNEREDLSTKTEDEFLESFESKHPAVEVEDFKIKNEEDKEQKLIENYIISLENESDNKKKIKLNLFLFERRKENPFKLNERLYPVNFGYKRSTVYSAKIKIPEGYTITRIPKDKIISLPNKGGSYIQKISHTDSDIILYSKYIINKQIYSQIEYHYLKEFMNQIIQAQSTPLELSSK